MAAGGLPAGEDNADVDGLGRGGLGGFLHRDVGGAVGVGEERLDLGLVADGFGGLALGEDDLQRAGAEGGGELGLVGLAGLGKDGQVVGHLDLWAAARCRLWISRPQR